ncbi:MAG: hemolysin activation/secretion protein [Alphaproteobacteria bacterium]|jgi:hemolysin activation/secretion protein
MINKKKQYFIGLPYVFMATSILAPYSLAAQSSLEFQNLPTTANPARIHSLDRLNTPQKKSTKLVIPQIQSEVAIPESARHVRFVLNNIILENVSAFFENFVLPAYHPYLGHNITLDTIWKVANKITQDYQESGFFLSRAYVPAQEIDGGIVKIKAIEGFIADVVLEDTSLSEYSLVRQLITRIKAKKPVNIKDLESFMLQMNALPGEEFRAVLDPVKNAEAGATQLLLRSIKETGRGSINFDNFGSRFLGPYQAIATYQTSIVPLQQTTFSALTSIPTDELKYAAFRHVIPIYPDWQIELSASHVRSAPGSSLEPRNIKSSSTNLGIGINWQPIRQRQENLITSVMLNGNNINGDIFENSPLTRDRIRTIQGRLAYDTSDSWHGYNYIAFDATQGLELGGASKVGDSNISRANADPNFTTVQLNYTRQQAINNQWMAVGQFSGQLASGALFSAQEFGFGGQRFGRAYDPSEITGDHGAAASLELRYLGFDKWQKITFSPYSFYDIGKVWNRDIDGINQSASSAGLGLRFNHTNGFSGNVGLAWPLSKDIENPTYGHQKNPRILLQIGHGF